MTMTMLNTWINCDHASGSKWVPVTSEFRKLEMCVDSLRIQDGGCWTGLVTGTCWICLRWVDSTPCCGSFSSSLPDSSFSLSSLLRLFTTLQNPQFFFHSRSFSFSALVAPIWEDSKCKHREYAGLYFFSSFSAEYLNQSLLVMSGTRHKSHATRQTSKLRTWFVCCNAPIPRGCIERKVSPRSQSFQTHTAGHVDAQTFPQNHTCNHDTSVCRILGLGKDRFLLGCSQFLMCSEVAKIDLNAPSSSFLRAESLISLLDFTCACL